MCVIMIADKDRPSDEMIQKALVKNSKGAGLAWREKGEVRYIKGLSDVEEILPLIQRLPMPFIFHARIDTCGGESKELTHPFPVDTDSKINLRGSTKGYMMFHNGHWGQWKDKSLEAAVKTGTKIPGGRWSDSRAMAFVASIYGLGALEFIDEKSVVISPTDIQVFGSGWTRVNNVVVSNKLWEDVKLFNLGTEKKAPAVSIPIDIKTEKPGGASHQETFRTRHENVQREEDLSEEVEEGSDGVSAGVPDTQALVPYEARTRYEEGVKQIEWVRSLNQSSFRRPLLPDTVEHDRRLEDARKGIIHLGKL